VSELHVGFDATFLEKASVAATLRTALIGLVLTACGLVGVGVSLVQRQRLREREEAAERIAEEEDRRRRSERLASAGALAAGVAHEVRNPLNAISVAAQRIERSDQVGPSCRTLATTIRDEVRRLDLIVRGFLDLARPKFGPHVESDAADIVRDVLDVLGPEAASRGIGLRLTREGSTTTSMDREAVRRAVVNLVRNAMQASPKGSAVEVLVSGDDSTVRVKVDDRGGGLDPALGEHVFDPFVTGRAEGTGLGLALVRRVAEDHGGWATLMNRPEGGVEAVLELRRGGPP
jgi:signal transduction histidine kinase